MHTHIKTHVQQALTAWFVIAENWTQSKYLSMVKEINCVIQFIQWITIQPMKKTNHCQKNHTAESHKIRSKKKKNRHERVCNAWSHLVQKESKLIYGI